MRGDPAAEVLRAEKVLEPLGQEAKRYTVHSVGHAHIDMNWMWPWPETDLLERPIENGTARVKGNGFTVDMPAYGIVTVRVRFKTGAA